MHQPAGIEELASLFESRYGLVIRVARLYAPDPELCRDIAQQVFLEFVVNAKRKNWDLHRDVNPLLHEITKNVARQFWCREKKHQTPAMRKIGEYYLKSMNADAEETDVAGERIELLNRCVEKLSPRSRRLIESHYFAKTPMNVIAEENRMKSNTVHQLFCRIRATLRECMERLARE